MELQLRSDSGQSMEVDKLLLPEKELAIAMCKALIKRIETQMKKEKKVNPIVWHHGTCDLCKKRHALVCHFGYDTQPERDYRLCKECLAKHIKLIVYGKDDYKNGLLEYDEFHDSLCEGTMCYCASRKKKVK